MKKDKHYKIKDVAQIIANKFGIKSIIYDTDRPDGQYQKITNPAIFNQLFPDFEFTSLDEGLSDTIEYYMENIDIIRQ